MKYLTILFFLLSSILLSKDYTLKWYNFITVLDSFEYKDKSIYRLVRADGSWEDNEGLYGSLKCLGPNKISANNEVENALRSAEKGPNASIVSLNFLIRLNPQPSIELRIGDG